MEAGTYEVAVIGGGAAGLATAWALARRGTSVVLLERREPESAPEPGGPSMVLRVGHHDAAHVRLGQLARRWWDVLEDEVGEELRSTGSCVDHGPVRVTRGIAEALLACEEEFEYLTGPDAEARWPGMRFDDRVVVQPSGGRVDMGRALQVLRAEADRLGAEIRDGVQVVAIEPTDDEVVLRVARSGDPDGESMQVRASAVVVTVADWSDGLLDGVPGLEALAPEVVAQDRAFSFPVLDSVASHAVPWPSFVHHVDPESHAEARGSFGPDAGYPEQGAHGAVTPGLGLTIVVRAAGSAVPAEPELGSGGAAAAVLEDVRAYVEAWVPGAEVGDPAPVGSAVPVGPDGPVLLDRIGRVVVGTGCSGTGAAWAPGIGQVLADLATGKEPEIAPEDLAVFALAQVAVVAA